MPSVTGGLGSSVTDMAAVHGQLAAGGLGADAGSGLAFGLPLTFSGQASTPATGVVASQTVQPGSVTLHLVDGSSIDVVGASHIDTSLFHG